MAESSQATCFKKAGNQAREGFAQEASSGFIIWPSKIATAPPGPDP